MPTIQFETAVGAGASNANFLSGSIYEFVRRPSLVSFAIVASATGAFVTITSGSDVIAEEFPPAVLTTMPVIPDQFYYSDYAAPGDRLVVKARNPTGGSITFRGIVQITETA